MKKLLLAAIAFAALPVAAQAQNLTGKRIGIQYYFPDLASPYGAATSSTVGTDGPVSPIGLFDLSFTGSTATASNFAFDSFWTPSSFNGFRLYDIDGTIGDFKVTLGASNMVGLDASRLSGDANNVYVNWQNLSFDRNTSVTLDFAQAGGVPEPASWAMMIGGFGLAGGALRRRKADARIAFA